MIDWAYWRWVTARNMPLAIIVFMAVVTSGVVGLRALPKEYSATSRTILEAPLAVSDTSAATRATQDVQHLQVVVHQLLSGPGRAMLAAESGVSTEVAAQDAVVAKIDSDRNKPAFLSITAKSADPSIAMKLTQAATRQAIVLSDKIQRERVEASLVKLGAITRHHEQAVASARRALDQYPATGGIPVDSLVEQASALRARIEGGTPKLSATNATLAKLQQDLSDARGLYSDIHPKVRVLRQRIALEDGAEVANSPAMISARLSAVEQQIALQRAAQATKTLLEQELAKAGQDLEQSQDALTTARLRGEESFARLQPVEDPKLPATGRDGKQMALIIALVLGAAALALGTVTLRLKADHRIHRPADLARTLGITPFATLPDLGPSLS